MLLLRMENQGDVVLERDWDRLGRAMIIALIRSFTLELNELDLRIAITVSQESRSGRLEAINS